MALGVGERAEPVVQAFDHAVAAFLDLFLQRRLEVLLLAFALVLDEGGVHVIDLVVVQALQQFDGRGGDFPGGFGDGGLGFPGALLQGFVGYLVGLYHGLEAIQPVEVTGQLGGAMPGQMVLEAFVEPVFFCAPLMSR
nr:hypothetical protein GCM10020185_11110 [Pseudomonas brassicacearum subsp. brassicacearum]